MTIKNSEWALVTRKEMISLLAHKHGVVRGCMWSDCKTHKQGRVDWYKTKYGQITPSCNKENVCSITKQPIN